MRKIIGICCLMFFLAACTTSRPVSQPTVINRPVVQIAGKSPLPAADSPVFRTDPKLETLLRKYPQFFESVLKNRRNWNVQIIYTQIDRSADNQPVFTPYYFNVSGDAYFYPASTVKLPVALLALEKLNDLAVPGLDKSTAMLTEAGTPQQTAVYNDPSSEAGIPSISQYIKKILLVSDNDAYNRLFEWVGQDAIHRSLAAKGLTETAIVHRLETSLSREEQKLSNPIFFTDANGRVLYRQPLRHNTWELPAKTIRLGKGWLNQGKLVDAPMDFSFRNRLPVEELDQVLKRVLFPEAFKPEERFRLTADDYRFLWQYMSQVPGESRFPDYNGNEFWSSYVKFLYYGSEPAAEPEKAIRIFNKVGDAYGTLTDAAYIVDFDHGIEYMITATIYCNEDGILNDDKYDYSTVGLPFMKNLGRVIYQLETERVKERKPDLSKFRLRYDK